MITQPAPSCFLSYGSHLFCGALSKAFQSLEQNHQAPSSYNIVFVTSKHAFSWQTTSSKRREQKGNSKAGKWLKNLGARLILAASGQLPGALLPAHQVLRQMPSDSRGTTAVTGRLRVCGLAARGPRLQGRLSGLVTSLSLLSEQEPQGAQLLSAALEELSARGPRAGLDANGEKKKRLKQEKKSQSIQSLSKDVPGNLPWRPQSCAIPLSSLSPGKLPGSFPRSGPGPLLHVEYRSLPAGALCTRTVEDSPAYVTARTGAASGDDGVTPKSVSAPSHKHPLLALGPKGLQNNAGGSGAVGLSCALLGLQLTFDLEQCASVPVCSGHPHLSRGENTCPRPAWLGGESSVENNGLSVGDCGLLLKL
ncbi:hypothetical protein P7K49_037712 [Saguinus oedipus]|uniref:Uncharacterized protein n=1 Tax=Saguinus oedipus TaxID=9490 RepID=A0ABQ9TIU1_SAGOE|nr:hypothetical protein P7K49_037712 [Saguinus oedipus]